VEHRKHPRFPIHFRSSFTSANLISGDGQLQDLSIRGCRIASLVEVKPGTALELRIEAVEQASAIHVKEAVVRWSRDGHIGLEFISLARDQWSCLQRVVKELELQPYQRATSDPTGR
jgi:hypothetical protein